MSFIPCTYTQDKKKKRQKWQEGYLKKDGHRVVLHNEHRKRLHSFTGEIEEEMTTAYYVICVDDIDGHGHEHEHGYGQTNDKQTGHRQTSNEQPGSGQTGSRQPSSRQTGNTSIGNRQTGSGSRETDNEQCNGKKGRSDDEILRIID